MATPLTIEQVPIDLLRPDPANPRCIGEEELDSLERSIRQFGFVQPVLVRREDQTVIGGHQRLVAARRLGLATVPLSCLDISVEQARLLNLALSKISGSWDDALLARLLADLQASPDLDLTLSGLEGPEVTTRAKGSADRPNAGSVPNRTYRSSQIRRTGARPPSGDATRPDLRRSGLVRTS
jgi:hypothetical protein